MTQPPYYFRLTQYGFTWGPVEVTRVMSDGKLGLCLTITTSKQRLQVRVTPSGLIRVRLQKLTDKDYVENVFSA